MMIHSMRIYGEPKLPKPKELKGISQTDSLRYIKTRVYVFNTVDGRIWLRFRDFFSRSMPVPNHLKGAPLSVLISELMEEKRHVKSFVYADTWGDIVLRQEAWLVVRGHFTDHINLACRLRQFEKVTGMDEFQLENTAFSRLLEKFIKR